MVPTGDVMAVVTDGRRERGRCPLCGANHFSGHCLGCGYLASAPPEDNPEWSMPGDPESFDVLSDYGYPFERFAEDDE